MNELIIKTVIFVLGILVIPFMKKIILFFKWITPEFGIVEEKLKTEIEQNVDNMVKNMSDKLEMQLHYGEKDES